MTLAFEKPKLGPGEAASSVVGDGFADASGPAFF
jgi:hypothetical protein